MPNIKELEKILYDVQIGGQSKPKDCISRDRVAIIIPYRNRSDHLRSFLFHLHTLLPRQQIGNIVLVKLLNIILYKKIISSLLLTQRHFRL